MPKRTVGDDEIALIKAMLARGMKNRDIQFYFNRPDRPVNSGRITQIRKGAYGPKISAATNPTLDTFISLQSKNSPSNVIAKRSVGDRAKDYFEKKSNTWFLRSHETDEAECRTSFAGIKPAERAAAVVKAIAGLANNRGGFLFFGVEELSDKSLRVTGLANEKQFAQIDPSELNQLLASVLDPVPVFQMGLAEIGGKQIGFIEVARHEGAPVIALRNLGADLKEGGIYYRYVGETRLIKPGELRRLLADRERRAVEQFVDSMKRVAKGAAATLDLDTGQVTGQRATFLLDEESLGKIQFLREGEFSEKEGAPALRLIGDVRVSRSPGNTRVVRQNVTQDAVLRDFLSGEPVSEPLAYILSVAHGNREWLPLWYFVHLSKLDVRDIVGALTTERPSQPTHRDRAVERLQRKRSAQKNHPGTPKKILAAMLDGKIIEPKSAKEDSDFALAIQGLPDMARDIEPLRSILLKVADRAQGTDPQTNGRRSNIFRAACRLDEVLYRPPASNKSDLIGRENQAARKKE